MKAQSHFAVPYEYEEGDKLICKMWATPAEQAMFREVANDLGMRFSDLFRLCFNTAAEVLVKEAREQHLQVVNGSGQAVKLEKAARPQLRIVEGGKK